MALPKRRQSNHEDEREELTINQIYHQPVNVKKQVRYMMHRAYYHECGFFITKEDHVRFEIVVNTT